VGEITINFKEGASYADPWITIKAQTVEEASAILQEVRTKGVFQGVKAASREFQAAVPGNLAQAVKNVTTAIPGSQEQKLPDSATPSCGKCSEAAQWKEGVSKQGTPYSGWYCLNRKCDQLWKAVK
jgi:hypothetical protein